METSAPEPNWFQLNLEEVQQDFEFLQAVLEHQIEAFNQDQILDLASVEAPPLTEGLPYRNFLEGIGADLHLRLVLLVALAPELSPGTLAVLNTSYPNGSGIPELGGIQGDSYKGILPTFDTLLFALAGKDFPLRNNFRLILQEHPVFLNHLILLSRRHPLDPYGAHVVQPSPELISLILTGDIGEPTFGAQFPAERIATRRAWEELILAPPTMNDVNEVLDWITYESVVMDQLGLRDKASPGFRCLFYGPPGTGKTFTATLIGQKTGRPVFRVDLSQVVSKYIGETEKNLRIVFDKAERRDWILFFDEADALFGKRTAISDSKDRFANQEVSYLLQRIEQHDGVVILATNHRDNLDKAFTRRFQLVVHFPMPTPPERLRLWQTALPSKLEISPEVNLEDLAKRFELSGGSIMNVIRFCALQAARRDDLVLVTADFMEGIKREYRKVGRILK